MNTATLNDILFPILLFIIYFCAASIWLHSNRSPENADTITEQLNTTTTAFSYKQAFSPDFDPEPEPEEISTDFADIASPSAEPTTEPTPEPVPSVDVTKLPLREARKIAKQLGIKQKVNGKDAPVSWLRAQIQQKLAEDASIAAVVADCLRAA
jgi:hypothetical protein